ncbi:CDGSH iron-sulfur domain-containing protein [Paraburkholderia hospita]|uniref:CDGSH iron-sulfur domain-containing protein n=1 Tax=Paraburkholderia hospita TaxID=169430 RepID=UPI0031345386
MHRMRPRGSPAVPGHRKARRVPTRRRTRHNSHSSIDHAMSIVKGHIMEGGPLHLVGDFEIVDAAGNSFPHSGIFSLCRCGHSESKPFCDGNHRARRWTGCHANPATETTHNDATSTQK